MFRFFGSQIVALFRLSSQQAPVHKLGDSQMTLSPKFRLVVVPSSLLNPSSEYESSLQGEPVIPGLPDDVALNCLLRLPVESHSACKAVCKRWHLLLGNKERFFTRRKELGFRDPWLFVFTFHKCTGKIQWQVWSLMLIVPLTKYEIQKNRWTVMNNMSTARSFFASEVINGMIYVAGGNSGDLFELDSAEVLDPAEGSWDPIANMGTNMASYDSAVLDDKLLVTEGWLWPFFVSPRGQLERMKLKVYDPGSDSWEAIEGPPLPEQICKPFAVSSCNNIIYVVGLNLHVAVGYISSLNQTGSSEKRSFGVGWHVINAPERLSDLTPSSSKDKIPKGYLYLILTLHV
ncbi:hypothetical protein GQ457_03G035490 [Hibiscus cannabinus]